MGIKMLKLLLISSKPTMIKKRLISPEKAKAVLGFEATTPLKEGLQKTISWYRSTL
jgi:nucleoside-diphosphate-sugar epimerase